MLYSQPRGMASRGHLLTCNAEM